MGEAAGIPEGVGDAESLSWSQMEVSRKASWRRSEAAGSRGRGTHRPAEEGRGARGQDGLCCGSGEPACEPGGAAERSPPAPGGRGCAEATDPEWGTGEAAARPLGSARACCGTWGQPLTLSVCCGFFEERRQSSSRGWVGLR